MNNENTISSTVCFTGPRPKSLCNYNGASYKSFSKWLENYIEELYKKGIKTFITGGAQGFDQIAFWAVHNTKLKYPDIKNVLYAPFKGQENQWKDTGLFSKDQYKQILNYADEVKYIYDTPNNEYKNIVKALYGRNHAMVNDSDMVIALYASEDYIVAKGGTAECIRYAINNQKRVYQIKYTITENVLRATNITTL